MRHGRLGLAAAGGAYLLLGATAAQGREQGARSLRAIVERQRATLSEQADALHAQQAAIQELKTQVADLRRGIAPSGDANPEASLTRPAADVARVREGTNPSSPQAPASAQAPADRLAAADTAQPNSAVSQSGRAAPNAGPRLRVGGRLQFDALVAPDAAPGEQEDLFIPRLINTTPGAPRGSRTRLIGRDTRLWADARWPTAFGGLRGFAEIDFFGALGLNDQTSLNVSSLRLRHAYVEAGPGRGRWLLTVGQTWSAFNDAEAYGSFFNALPFGSVFVRQGQARLTAWFGQDLSASVSVENPEAEIAGVKSDDFDELPDLVLNVRSERNWGNVQAGLLLRRITELQTSAPRTAWGVNLGGVIRLGGTPDPTDRLRFQINYGKGIGRYVGELAAGFDGALDADANMLLNTVFAGNVSLEHRWSNRIFTNLGLSRVQVDYGAAPAAGALEATTAVTANVDFKPTEATDLVAEYSLGRRDDVDGRSGIRSFARMSARLTF